MPQKYEGKVAVRKIDIVEWKSAAFLQANSEFGIGKIPYLRVYAPDGSFVGSESVDLMNLYSMIEENLK